MLSKAKLLVIRLGVWLDFQH